jgi:nicotinamidase-related amidase
MQYTEELILQKAQAAFDHGDAVFAVHRNTCALLVIDMQDEFVKPGWTSSWIPEATRQVPRIKRLITYCRQTGIPVIYTVFSATHGYLDRPRYGSAMPNRFPDLGQDPRWFKQGKIWDELAPLPHDIVIHKPSYGAFYDTPLETILKNSGKDTLIISGTLTNCCCGTTARQAYERGYKVIFGSDITSTYTEEMQRAELGILRFAFAKVMRAEDIIACLEQGGEPRPPDRRLCCRKGN